MKRTARARSADSSSTAIAGLFGNPVKHSVSPLIHNRAIEELGLDMQYIPFEVDRTSLAEAIENARALGLVGFNVTHPLKEAIIPHLDRLTDTASAVKAVNTVASSSGKLVGHNTDASGLINALRLFASFSMAGKRAVVIGSGGAARAAVFGLLEEGSGDLTIFARNEAAAQEIAKEMRAIFPSANLSVENLYGDAKRLRAAVARADLIVNATPIGMGTNEQGRHPMISSNSPAAGRLWADLLASESESCEPFRRRPPCLVLDLVYFPLETALLEKARALGHPTLNGLTHLVCQASLSFEIWTGRRFDERRMMSWLEARNKMECSPGSQNKTELESGTEL